MATKSSPKISAFDACLEPLLKALHWQGALRYLKESLPHLAQIESVGMFCQVMGNLNYEHHELSVHLHEMDERLMPCLFVDEKGDVLVLLEKKAGNVIAFDGNKQSQITLNRDMLAAIPKGKIYVFKTAAAKKSPVSKENWIRKIFQANRSLVYNALALSFVLNILALATPIFIMSVYNRVIGALSVKTLHEFAIGMAAVLIAMILVIKVRARLLALLGSRLDRDIGNQIIERLLYLAPGYTETASLGSQVARIKDFDRVREFLAGPLLAVFFDLPFIFIALLLIAILGGVLIVVPALLVVIFILLTWGLNSKVKRSMEETSRTSVAQQEFLIETIQNFYALKYSVAEEVWINRYREFSANLVFSGFRAGLLTAIDSGLSDILMIVAGMGVVVWGAVNIMAGTLSVGAMIAVMILVWRVLSPLKTLFNTLPHLIQIKNSITQIDRLMKIEPESTAQELLTIHYDSIRGDVRFNRVSFRYPTSADPALLGVNFMVKAGTLVGVVGRNGSGKSTLLKLILGLYYPQGGSVYIDSHDIRQLNPIELRNVIAYLPQTPELFYGTIAQNLRMADLAASEEDLQIAAKKAGVLEQILSLPQGFDTPLKDYSTSRLAGSFQQCLCLARMYLRPASIFLLDEPANNLDLEGDLALMNTLEEFRNKKTVFIVTHRPSHLKKMDRIILLEQGQIAIQGAPDQVLPKIPKGYL